MVRTLVKWSAQGLLRAVCLVAGGMALLSVTAMAEDSGVQTEIVTVESTANPQATMGAPVYVSLEPEFTINYGQGGRLRYLKTAVSLAVQDSQAALEVNTHSDAIRHEIIMMISEQSGDEIRSAQSRREMQQALLERIRDFMEEETGEPLVENVLFTSFIVQG